MPIFAFNSSGGVSINCASGVTRILAFFFGDDSITDDPFSSTSSRPVVFGPPWLVLDTISSCGAESSRILLLPLLLFVSESIISSSSFHFNNRFLSLLFFSPIQFFLCFFLQILIQLFSLIVSLKHIYLDHDPKHESSSVIWLCRYYFLCLFLSHVCLFLSFVSPS